MTALCTVYAFLEVCGLLVSMIKTSYKAPGHNILSASSIELLNPQNNQNDDEELVSEIN